MFSIWDIIGYVGSLLIIFGFFMVTRARWSPQSLKYLLISLTGSVLLGFYQLHLNAYAGILLNIIFGLVAVWGIISFVIDRKK
jgi:hypothetical protein